MVRRIKQEQFADCVTRYERLIITICYSMTKNYFDAEDLAQETFLSAYRHLKSFEGENPKAWLTAIAVNKCRDYLKSPARRNGSLTDEDAALLADTGATPEKHAENRASEDAVRRLCGRLKDPYRSVAEGYFCEGRKLSEMARDTGQSLKTLETRLYRSKKLLKKLWKEEHYALFV